MKSRVRVPPPLLSFVSVSKWLREATVNRLRKQLAVHELLSGLIVRSSQTLSWGPTRTEIITGYTPELQAAMERIKEGYDRKKLQPDITTMFLAVPPSVFIEAAKQDQPYHAFVERLLQSNASENLES